MHLAQHARHQYVHNVADIKQSVRADPVLDGPSRDIEHASGIQFDRCVKPTLEPDRILRPGRMPGGDQHRIRMAGRKALERQQHEVLPFAILDLAAREDVEAIRIEPA